MAGSLKQELWKKTPLEMALMPSGYRLIWLRREESILHIRRVQSSHARRKGCWQFVVLSSKCRTDIENLTLDLLLALWNISITWILPSKTSHGTLQNNLSRLISAAASETLDSSHVWPLLTAVLARKPANDIWNCVYNVVTEPTPSPRAIASSLQQTPWLHKTSSFANSSEYRQDIDRVLRSELGPLYVGLPHL